MARREMHRSMLRLARRIFGGVMLGVAAIFVPKSRTEDHWSTVTTVVIVDAGAA